MDEKPRLEERKNHDPGSEVAPLPRPILTLGRLLGALAFTVAVTLVCGSIRPEAGEPLLLRWMRVLADHPVRGFLAAALLILAATPAPEAPGRS